MSSISIAVREDWNSLDLGRDRRMTMLYIEEKRKTQHVAPYKKLVPRLVTSCMMQQHPVGLPTSTRKRLLIDTTWYMI